MASTLASPRASRRADKAEQAPVRIAVIAVPSSKATGAPVRGSNAAIIAWCVGSPVPALRGNSDTSLVISTPAEGTKPGIAARNPSCSGTSAATRSGTEARPALKSAIAAASASISASTSTSASTRARVRTSIRHPSVAHGHDPTGVAPPILPETSTQSPESTPLPGADPQVPSTTRRAHSRISDVSARTMWPSRGRVLPLGGPRPSDLQRAPAYPSHAGSAEGQPRRL